MEPTNMGRCMVGVPGLDQKRECFACNGDEPASFFFFASRIVLGMVVNLCSKAMKFPAKVESIQSLQWC